MEEYQISMPDIVLYILSILAAYLLGSVPMGVFVVRAYTGKDIRETGSGRIGGTNAMRAAGLHAGVITGLSDIAKGFGAVYIGRLLAPGVPWVEMACGAAAVAGHNWSIYLRFKGGAGAATNIGAATALWPFTAPILVPAGVAILFLTGYASVTSTFVAVGVPIVLAVAARAFGLPWVYVLHGVATLIMIALALVPNYRRLLQGTERVVGPRAKALAAKRDNGVAASGA
jgi:glycerol-3-phosphate acyltransferase PlsY